MTKQQLIHDVPKYASEDLILSLIDTCLYTFEGFNKNEMTVLMFVCRCKMEKVCLKILENPFDCELTAIDIYGYTALTYAQNNNMTNVVNRINEIYENAVFILFNMRWLWICKNEQKCIRQINSINKTELNKVNADGRTVLIISCSNICVGLSLEILKYPKECALNQIDNDGNTALIWTAKCYDISMKPVMLKILEYCNTDLIDHADNRKNTFATILERNREHYSDILEIVKIKSNK